MDPRSLSAYRPLDTLKRVAEDLWIVDGPLIRFGPPMFKMPFPTRMTIVRVRSGELFIHSPTRLTPELVSQVKKIGSPLWIIAPNRLHHWWIPDWKNAFPAAEIFLAPRVIEQSKGRIDFDYTHLAQQTGYPWDAALATLPVTGSYMTEVVFFHRASRTLILADLIENFEPKKIASPILRWMAWMGGALSPNGSMPRDLRLTFARQRPALKAAVETMIGWNPERIILAHGRWYERNGVKELRRAFHWLLA